MFDYRALLEIQLSSDFLRVVQLKKDFFFFFFLIIINNNHIIRQELV